MWRSEEHTSELQSRRDLVCRLLLEKKKKIGADLISLASMLRIPVCMHNVEDSKFFLLFFFNDTATTEIYTLSLHDALPIGIRRQPALQAGASPLEEAVDRI